MAEYTMRVDGMSCASCERLVEDAVTNLDGVKSVDADAQADRVAVVGDERTRERAEQAVSETGYTPV